MRIGIGVPERLDSNEWNGFRTAFRDIVVALDEHEKDAILKRINGSPKKGKAEVQRFKGLGEMNPSQLRETVMFPDSRRLVQLTLEDEAHAGEIMDMLLSRKRSQDRKKWLEEEGDLAE